MTGFIILNFIINNSYKTKANFPLVIRHIKDDICILRHNKCHLQGIKQWHFIKKPCLYCSMQLYDK